MPRFSSRAESDLHESRPHAASLASTAVLLVNLGTPEAPDTVSVRRYLREFLSDPHVVILPRLLWLPLLHGIVLNVRPKHSAARYQKIWTTEGSPLKIHTEKQAKLLRGFLGADKHPMHVAYAMRYGRPALDDMLTRLHRQGMRRILLLPLYPQYATSTMATVFDAAEAWAARVKNPPKLVKFRLRADDPRYIAALAASIREHWMREGQPDPAYRLVMSFHGVPRRTIERGDPYYDECLKTAALLAHELGLSAEHYRIAFQSYPGYCRWLSPRTDETLAELGAAHTRRVDVICPGFVSDCLETLEEIAIEGKKTFLAAGGGEFHYIPCLNERDDWIHTLARRVIAHTRQMPD